MVFDGLLFKKIYMEKLFGVLVAGVILVYNAKAQSAVRGCLKIFFELRATRVATSESEILKTIFIWDVLYDKS